MSTSSQSKLMTQLQKEQLLSSRSKPDEKRLQDIYAVICKTEPGNLKLVEFINLVLEKGLMTNAHGIRTYTNIFQQFTSKSIESDALNIGKGSSMNPDEEKKFHKHKFLKMFTELAKRLYPGDDVAFQKVFYNRLLNIEGDDGRMRLDENMRKLISKETLKYLLEFEEPIQKIFVMYIPENYNKSMDFSWKQAKMLDRRMPIVSLVRFLVECDVCPHYLSVNSIFEIIAKYIPPSSNNHRQVIFYSAETASNYSKEYLNSAQIKILDGDVGLNFNELLLIMARLSIELYKDTQQKPDYCLLIKRFFVDLIGLQPNGEHSDKKNKLTMRLNNYSQGQTEKKIKKPKKPEAKTDVDMMTLNEQEDVDNIKSRAFHRPMLYDIDAIRKSIEEDTPGVPDAPKSNKENEGLYNFNEKYVVIGEQLPKIPEKAKPPGPKPKKQPDELLGYKPELPKVKIQSYSHLKEMQNTGYKLRKASQFYPVLLSEVASPQNLDRQAQMYVQTAFINLASHNYDGALLNLKDAREIQKVSRVENQMFFYFLQGQIYEAMGKDEVALECFYKCKGNISLNSELVQVFKNNEACTALPFCGLGSCLYHAQQHEHALRCFLKAKQIREKIFPQNSIQMANIYNNIGCCFIKLNRAHEARKYFELSYSILDLQLGVYHQKTLTVFQNLSKAKKSYVERIPEFKVLWRTYERKEGIQPPKKKTK